MLKGLNNTLVGKSPKLVIEILKKDERKIIDHLARLGYARRLVRTDREFEGGLSHYSFQKQKQSLTHNIGLFSTRHV